MVAPKTSPSSQNSAERTPVVSEPLLELVGQGKNEKYVKECTQLHLGGKGIEKLEGFERLKNLEVLFLNNNKLTHISHLESNFRLRRLYLANNKLFTLKGDSLKALRNLNQLDLTNNNLRDLKKVLANLEHLKFLRELELIGNLCCEEPDYRLLVIHKIPSIQVLDSRVVSDDERQQAKVFFGLDITSSKLAFGGAAPPRPGPPPPMPAGGPVGKLEQDLNQAVKEIKERESLNKRSEEEEILGIASGTLSSSKGRGNSLPPPPGWPQLGIAEDPSASNASDHATTRTRDLLRLTHFGRHQHAELTEEEKEFVKSLPDKVELDKALFESHVSKIKPQGAVHGKLNVLEL
mmetsp:Transcript_22596/g.27269  ORF Transcript_22596/g.27269 Transcript_22596/m.27269 type:complete len:349 (+) Transcript_22596:220-1266(+)|eukprot:CAMPEP_0197854828 /NCGR_PEP_ID=MMETSP1438-20131217/25419_1 /TAXON_ID=1461541 /ORGANISM="Pterosperma sp., Strain CCMP1384" /LENGTH=348 /DNA_ID=CAMNT_0043469715 /DNA_START=220 /DNA_END=1266 /DNA_ORIENTATION=+